MAFKTSLFLISLVFAVFIVVTSQPRNSNVSLGSILSPTKNDSWLSSSGLFTFGFYPESNGFFVGIWFNNGNTEKTVVWTANQTAPPLSSNVSLHFTSDKGVFLYSKEGPEIPVASISDIASYASMLDSGNFVLYNSDSKIIWQSFDWPTDTLLSGQSLRSNLYSSVSATNHSKGRFILGMQADGNLVSYPNQDIRIATAYWASNTAGNGNNVSLNLDPNGDLYLLKERSIFLFNLTRGFPQNGSSILLYRLTLDFDGIFRLYSITLNQNSSNWSITWSSSSDGCVAKGICGENSYCTVMDQKAACLCLPGFEFVHPGLMFSDCKKMDNNSIEEGCRSNDLQMFSLNGINWEENSYSTVWPTTEENCKQDCLLDCGCEVVLFLSNEGCRKQKLPLKYGSKNLDDQSQTFVKLSKWSPPRNEQVEEKGNDKKFGLNIILLISLVVITTTALIILVICSVIFHKYRLWAYERMKDQVPLQNELTEDIVLRSFTYGELEKLTDNFKEELGRGAFGTVFKGSLSNNGERLIAAKRLEKVEDEGEMEFLTEMKVIGRTHHRNLVRLLGYCDSRFNKVLVYEYMSNGSLADLLFKSKELPCWYERVGIALNIAKGILYLHEECETQIIHCDIKPQNILMDEYLCPKISDFGLAKLLKQDQTRTLTMIRGTRGYVAPEWHGNRPITVKVDVFSFGIVLLEIICCRRCVDTNFPEEEAVLSDWVYDSFEDGELAKLVTDEDVDQENLERIVKVGLWCIQEDPSMRPSMKKVVLMLEGIVEVPSPPTRGSFSNL